MALVLYSTEACHLCDEAVKVLVETHQTLMFEVYVEDIAESEALVEKYGTRIPVLFDEQTNKELDWPFTSGEAQEFISSLVSDL